MSGKPVVLRERAQRDIEEAVVHYLTEGSSTVAATFVDALQDGLRFISEQPRAGSPRYAHELEVPGLRCWSLGQFPHLIFYVERETEVDVWRVLHGARDVPAGVREPP